MAELHGLLGRKALKERYGGFFIMEDERERQLVLESLKYEEHEVVCIVLLYAVSRWVMSVWPGFRPGHVDLVSERLCLQVGGRVWKFHDMDIASLQCGLVARALWGEGPDSSFKWKNIVSADSAPVVEEEMSSIAEALRGMDGVVRVWWDERFDDVAFDPNPRRVVVDGSGEL